jgi:hypothetical protein
MDSRPYISPKLAKPVIRNPLQSNGPVAATREFGIRISARARPMIPSGTLSRKIHGHEL